MSLDQTLLDKNVVRPNDVNGVLDKTSLNKTSLDLFGSSCIHQYVHYICIYKIYLKYIPELVKCNSYYVHN
jgi:hypothetical protein